MKNNKFENIFFTFSWVIYFIGILITSILMVKYSKNIVEYESNWMPILCVLPTVICVVISFSLLVVYLVFKRKYFYLVNMHIQKKWIFMTYWSIGIVALNQIIGIILIIVAYSLTPKDVSSYYMYVLLAISMLINLIAVVLNTFSKFMIKLDIAIKRKGNEFKEDEISKIIEKQTSSTIDHTTN